MTARRLPEINGDFRGSPLIETARRFHQALAAAGTDYAIAGGLAVARSGALRTTQDVDVLTRREEWPALARCAAEALVFGVDQATDRASGVTVAAVGAELRRIWSKVG